MLKNNLFVKVALGSLLIIFLRVELVFLDLLPTGGDMGAHIVPTKFFVNELFNNFKLSGWSQDWFAGYPVYYFYFPLPPIITSLLNFLFPFSISFKIMVLISQVLLVISIELLMRKNSKEFSFYGFGVGLLYLLTESFTIFGGNLASSLAGQYSFTYSIAFGNLSIFYLLKSKYKYSIEIASLLLGLSVLSHLIPFMIYLPIFAFYFLKSDIKIFKKISAFLFFLFVAVRFSFSLFLNLEFTTNMTYTPYTQLSDLVKSDVLPFVIGAAIYIISSKSKTSLKAISGFEIYLLSISIYLFFYGPESALWNGRIVPFFNLGIIILFFNLLHFDIKNLTKKIQGKYPLLFFILLINSYFMYLYYSKWGNTYSITTISVILIVLFIFLISINSKNFLIYTTIVSLTFGTLSYLPHWLNWNFSGYESKNNWADITTLYEGLNTLEPGRIMWEPNSDLNKYGTPMVLMTIPMFTDHQSVEGLYFDSSITTPFHFLTVSGVAERPSNPVGGLTYINGEFDKGFRLMKDLGVDYFIAYTSSIKDKANKDKNFNFLFSNEVFNVYSINSEKVQLIEDNLYVFESPDFNERLRNAVLREGSEQSFFEAAYKTFKDELNYKIIENYDISFVEQNDKNTELLISDLNIQNELITFKTNKPNQLHLIKVSYFPNWKIKNGYGPFRISPSFMAVVPKDELVEIKFESSNVEKALNYLSIFALFSALFITYTYKKRFENVK
tara:strand:- start:5477 stop:7654 length:2178 start_codon:yes stop_codon:yes gene_type:complete